MTQQEIVAAAVKDIVSVSAQADGVRVCTHCMYPTGEFVQVLVRGGTDTFVVSDEGSAIFQIESAGAELPRAEKLIQGIVQAQGLEIRNGIISAPPCNRSSLAVMIAVVANASKDAAEWFFQNVKVERHRKFKAIVAELVRTDAPNVRSDEIVGESNKPHRFDNIILLSDDRRLVIDAVTHDPNSIAARVLANMDVRNRHYAGLEQRIVYDDSDEWKPEDLALLQNGAPLIAFSRATKVISRLTAH